jgi:alkylation response protein AidB-like acyl-CoA dehydrogenase
VPGYYASQELRDKYLNEVARMDWHTATGGTWATEQHGGSDIGATTTIAVLKGGRFASHGSQWSTGNANSGAEARYPE